MNRYLLTYCYHSFFSHRFFSLAVEQNERTFWSLWENRNDIAKLGKENHNLRAIKEKFNDFEDILLRELSHRGKGKEKS